MYWKNLVDSIRRVWKNQTLNFAKAAKSTESLSNEAADKKHALSPYQRGLTCQQSPFNDLNLNSFALLSTIGLKMARYLSEPPNVASNSFLFSSKCNNDSNSMLQTSTPTSVSKSNFNNVMYSDKLGMVVNVNIAGFNATDVSIKVEEGFLVVEAQVESKEKDGGILYRQMVKQFEIPSYYDITNITVKANGDKLVVTIPPAKPHITRLG